MTSVTIDRTDGLNSAAAIKGPVRVATTGNIVLTGLQTIDGVALVAGDRVLVKDQTAGSENGIYVVDTGPWRRSKDFNKTKDVVQSTFVLVSEGTLNVDKSFKIATANPIVVGTTVIVFEEAFATADQGQLAENAVTVVETRVEMKALNTNKRKGALLRGEGARNGTFAWLSGNFSTQVAADPQEAIYVSSAPTLGAWVRQAGFLVDGIDIAWAGGNAQAAATLAAAIGAKTVKGSGTVTLTSTLSIPSGVKLFGAGQALTITQGNGANLGELVTIADSANVLECVLDGNRANNADNPNFVTLRVGNSNDCVVERNIVKNCCGSGIAVNNGLRASIRKNVIFNFHDFGVAAFGNNAEHAHLIEDNWMHTVGWAGIILQSSDRAKILNNRIKGQVIGGRDARLNVNLSGTTVTWVSGPTFTGIVPGNFVVANSGAEFRISTVDSPTQLTVETALPTLSNTPATVGSGDLIGIIASSFCNISKNTLERTATFLFGFSLGNGAQCGNNSFVDNILNFAGKNAINLSGVGTGLVDNNSIIDNKIFNAGYGAGIGTNDAIAIFIEGASAGKVENTLIENNTVLSFAGSGQTTYWFGTDGNMSFGSVQVKGNKSQAVVNKSAIFNDILSITLSADWGSTASTGSITSNGEQAQFNITCAGVGYAGNPNFTVNKVCDTPNDPPIVTAKIIANAGGALLNIIWGEQTSLRGQWKAFMAATPAAGHIYTMQVKT